MACKRTEDRARCAGCGQLSYTLYCDRCAPPAPERSYGVDCDTGGASLVRTDRRRNGDAAGSFRALS